MSDLAKTTPVDDLKETAREAAEEFREAATVRAQELRDVAAEGSSALRAAAGPEFDQAKEAFGEFLDKGERYVRENPGRAVLTAVGVGFVLGVIFKR